MLTPEYLDRCTDEILGIYDELNKTIVEDIARRIVKTGDITSAAALEIIRAQESGKLLEDIVGDIGSITGFSNKYIQTIFNNAGIECIKNESDICTLAGLKPIELKQSPAMIKTLAAGIEKTKGDINNFTMTTAAAAQNAYIQATNMAYMQVSSGAFSYQEAIKQAIRSAASEGGTVIFPKRTDRLDVAIRRSVLTGVNQTAGKLTDMYADEMDCDLVETTAHCGARPSHALWQGQVFSRSGRSRIYPTFVESTGYGTVGGLCGANCRHNFHMFFEGFSKRAYSKKLLDSYSESKYSYKGSNLTDYACSQIQRQYERDIRESKRILAGLNSAIRVSHDEALIKALQEEFTAESVLLKATEADMKNFCKQTNRYVDNARTQVYAIKDHNGKIINFGKSASQKAVWANRKTS